MSLSPSPGFTSSEAALDRVDALLRDASSVSQGVISHLHSRLDEARQDVSRARELWTSADASLDRISQTVEEKLASVPLVAREPGTEASSRESVATQRSSSDTESDLPNSPGFATELLMLDSCENYGSLLKPWPRTSDATKPRASGPTDSIAHIRSHKSMSDLRQVTPPPTQDGTGASSKPVRRARADTLTDIGMRGGRSREHSETGSEGEGKRARLKAWLKRTFLPERLPRSPVQKVEEPPSSLTTLVEKDENVAIPNAPVQPCYRVLATVGKDLARIDECMSSSEKLIASAHRTIVRVERKMRRALQARKKLIHDHRRTRTSTGTPRAEHVSAEQHGRHQTSPPLRVIIPRTESPATSPAQSPITRSTTSSISSIASVQRRDGAETEADTEILKRMYVKKVEGRFERAYEGLEKADTWLKIVTKVLEDVEERRGIMEERM